MHLEVDMTANKTLLSERFRIVDGVCRRSGVLLKERKERDSWGKQDKEQADPRIITSTRIPGIRKKGRTSF